MKLNKDNYELLMFDLLEGNLSEADELNMMKQIEADAFLFREWNLFKSTVLIADKDVVFADKSSLLKEEKGAVIALFRPWMAVAASVAILAVAFVFWPAGDAPQLADTPVAEKNGRVEKVSPSVNPKETLLEEELVQEKSTAIQIPKNAVGLQNKKADLPPLKEVEDFPVAYDEVDIQPGHVTEEEENADWAKINAQQEEDRRLLDERLLQIRKDDKLKEESEKRIADVAQDEKNKFENKIVTPNMPENTDIQGGAEDIAVAPVVTPREKFIAFVTNKPLQRITTTTAAILVKARNPKLKVKPDFKSTRPSLKIEFESEGYQAMASLQPFKNKNN